VRKLYIDRGIVQELVIDGVLVELYESMFRMTGTYRWKKTCTIYRG
jgi:hypothetical protein